DEKPDVIIAAFGFNESFAGPKGLEKFKKDLDKFITDSTSTKYNGKAAPKLVLLSPIAHEDLGNPHVTDGKANNENIAIYTKAMAEAAGKHKIVFVDLFTPTRQVFADPNVLTINGIHLNETGDVVLASILDRLLFGPRPDGSKADLAKL